MLILQRKENQSLLIGDQITVTIADIGTDWVKLAIDAPREITILRSELAEAATENLEASHSITEQSLKELKLFFNDKKESQE